MKLQRKSANKNSRTAEDFKKQLPIIAKSMTYSIGEDRHILPMSNHSSMNRGKPFLKIADRSISMRTTPKAGARENKSFNDAHLDSSKKSAKISFMGDISKFIRQTKESMSRVAIKRNKTVVERTESPDLEVKGAAKSSMNDDLMSRGQLYQKIKNKPASTKAVNREVIRITKPVANPINSTPLTKPKRKPKNLDVLDISNFENKPFDHLSQIKKAHSTKSKTKSVEIPEKSQDLIGFSRTPARPASISEGRVPYSLVPTLEPPRHSTNSFKYIKSYAVNTFKGLIREYNEDRVSIILNIVQPENKKHLLWPNCSFFAVDSQ